MLVTTLFLKANNVKASRAQKWAIRWKSDTLEVLKKVGRIEKRLKKQEAVVEREVERYRSFVQASLDEISELRTVVDRYDKAEDALTTENELLRDVALPNAMSIIEDLRQQVAANTALNVGRQVLFGTNTKEQQE